MRAGPGQLAVTEKWWRAKRKGSSEPTLTDAWTDLQSYAVEGRPIPGGVADAFNDAVSKFVKRKTGGRGAGWVRADELVDHIVSDLYREAANGNPKDLRGTLEQWLGGAVSNMIKGLHKGTDGGKTEQETTPVDPDQSLFARIHNEPTDLAERIQQSHAWQYGLTDLDRFILDNRWFEGLSAEKTAVRLRELDDPYGAFRKPASKDPKSNSDRSRIEYLTEDALKKLKRLLDGDAHQ